MLNVSNKVEKSRKNNQTMNICWMNERIKTEEQRKEERTNQKSIGFNKSLVVKEWGHREISRRERYRIRIWISVLDSWIFYCITLRKLLLWNSFPISKIREITTHFAYTLKLSYGFSKNVSKRAQQNVKDYTNVNWNNSHIIKVPYKWEGIQSSVQNNIRSKEFAKLYLTVVMNCCAFARIEISTKYCMNFIFSAMIPLESYVVYVDLENQLLHLLKEEK